MCTENKKKLFKPLFLFTFIILFCLFCSYGFCSTNEIKQTVLLWKDSWESKDIDGYMEFYTNNFNGNANGVWYNRSQWKDYKRSTFRKFKIISINISNFRCNEEYERACVKFDQYFEGIPYSGSTYVDSGLKHLHLVKIYGKWYIEKESWSGVTLQNNSLDCCY